MARGATATMRRGPMRGRPTRGGNKTSEQLSRDLAALPVTPPFFSFDRAALGEPLYITRVVAVTVPMADLRDRGALHEHVVKKLLHKPYSPSAEERQQAGSNAGSTLVNGSKDTEGNPDHGGSCAARTHIANDRSDNHSPRQLQPHEEEEAAQAPYVVVHMDHLEVHSDTARQVNSRGDVQLNVMLTMTIAQVKRHGLLVGVAEDSPFQSCMQIKLPLNTQPQTQTLPQGHTSDKMKEGKAKANKRRRAHAEEEEENTSVTAAQTEPAPSFLRMTVRCLEEEPVVAGQAVLVVSEPGGCLRCLALRPPRRAPGPFRLVCNEDGTRTEIVCDMPERKDGRTEGGAKMRQRHE